MPPSNPFHAKIVELTGLADEQAKAAELCRQRYEDALRVCELTRARLEGLQIAVGLLGRPFPTNKAEVARSSGDVPRPRGKQLGSISMEWRAVLAAHVAAGNDFASPKDIAATSTAAGHPVEMKPTRDRMRKYISLGFAEREGDLYRVSQSAIDRFGLRREAPAQPNDLAAVSSIETAA